MIEKIIFNKETIFEAKKSNIERDNLLVQIFNNGKGEFVVYCGDKFNYKSPYALEKAIPFNEIKGFHPSKLIHKFGKFSQGIYSYYYEKAQSAQKEIIDIRKMILEVQKQTLEGVLKWKIDLQFLVN